MPSQLLSKLVETLNTLQPEYPSADLEIKTLVFDSRKAEPDSLFIAIAGEKDDGAKYIEDAIQRGATAIVVDKDTKLPKIPAHIAVLRSDDIRLDLAKLAKAFYSSQPKFIAAVTGTDGKTSTAHFMRELLNLSGYKCASIGTLGMIGENGQLFAEATHTTPDPIFLHKYLATIKTQGFEHVVLEASSHGLDQRRLDGLDVAAAAFTNLTRDHLDYHSDVDSYFNAKTRLFLSVLKPEGLGVINAEDEHKETLIRILAKRGCRILQYGAYEEAELKIERIVPQTNGQKIQLNLLGKTVSLAIPLVGNFQVYNMLAAVGLASETGLGIEHLANLLPKLTGVPGRLERVGTHPKNAQVFVDYAHTPGALTKALETLRHHTERKLCVIFGCGGDRDKGKRPEMGAAAAQLADLVIVTDDNPRSEDPATIRRSVLEACPHAKEVGNRREAIAYGLKQLSEGDVLLIAGKGHEKEQIIGNVKHHFSDSEVVLEEIERL